MRNLFALFLCLAASVSWGEVSPIRPRSSSEFLVSVSSFSGADGSLAATTEKLLFWVDEDTDTASGFDVATASSVITIPDAGLYLVTCQVSIETAGTELDVTVYRNASDSLPTSRIVTQAICDPTTASSASSCITAKVLKLLSGDTLKCSAYSQTATRIKTNERESYFQAVRLF